MSGAADNTNNSADKSARSRIYYSPALLSSITAGSRPSSSRSPAQPLSAWRIHVVISLPLLPPVAMTGHPSPSLPVRAISSPSKRCDQQMNRGHHSWPCPDSWWCALDHGVRGCGGVQYVNAPLNRPALGRERETDSKSSLRRYSLYVHEAVGFKPSFLWSVLNPWLWK